MSTKNYNHELYARDEIRSFVLHNRLGMIPDAAGDFLSIQAIAAILGREEQTVQKKLPKRLIRRHSLGAYFRLHEAVKAMEAYDAGQEVEEDETA